MTSVADIARALEAWAPRDTAQSYDNVGLQIGRADKSVQRALVSLDLTPEILDEAIAAGVDMIITHHPLLFRPLRSLTSGRLVSGLALRVAESRIALYAAHTNLDAAHGGVSFALAESLGLQDVDFLTRLDESLLKLVTFVPSEHEGTVRAAVAAVGAGQIGNYDSCAFATLGTGYFRAGEGANPAVGAADGSIQSVDEVRLEVEVPKWHASRVIDALKNAHPYEEVAYDLYPVQQPYTRAGLGAIGNLPVSMERDEFLTHVAKALSLQALRYSGSAVGHVSRVAVCGGAGSDLIGAARQSRADAFVTSDVTYHRFFEVMDDVGRQDLLLIDAGHYETEVATERLLVEFLAQRFGDVEFRRTALRSSPIRYHLP
ncbi:MAG: Nif3-like dinuclear metal center hexameric protein [Rhodothermales bacterium]|nr:Nif3-like dinuclear metal center hexameric protein [Rhodothermales bacterium]